MIYVYDGVMVNDRIRRAVATTVELDAPHLTHMFYSSYIVLQFNDDTNSYMMFQDKDAYIDYLTGMYDDGGLFGDMLEGYRSVCELVLRACKRETYLRGKLEFTFEEMKAISEHYKTGWFSEANMARWETELVKTLPYRMFITRDIGVHGDKVANLRMMTKDGYVITLLSQQSSVDELLEVSATLINTMEMLCTKEKAIMADLQMGWDTARERGVTFAMTFKDFSGNSFTLASNSLSGFSLV